MREKICFLLLLLTNLSAVGQEYLWPTDASQYMTSSFTESRPRRFHAGIDVKTWNQVGFKVFAVRSGYIERMAVSPFGYGRVLYLRLDTGETAVYAHLEAFNEKLQAIAEEEQERVGRYRIDKFFRPWILPVEQGEVIGYTGQSGIGVPHLHFEMRDSRSRPFNPLLRGFKVTDHVPPTVTALAFSPLEPGAMVNGDFTPVILRPRWLNGRQRIAETIHISGKVGVAVDTYDQADGVDNQFGIYRLQLLVDGQLQFQAQYDRFAYSQNKLIELDQDFLLQRRGWGRFHRLYRVAGNSLGFYSHLSSVDGALISRPEEAITPIVHENGVVSSATPSNTPVASHPLEALTWGEHRMQVVVEDFFGNRTVVETDLLVGAPFTFSPQIIETQPGRLMIEPVPMPANRVIRKVEAAVTNPSSRTIISPWRPVLAKWNASSVGSHEAFGSASSSPADTLTEASAGAIDKMAGSAQRGENPIARVLEIQTRRDELVRLVAVDQYGLRSHPAFIFEQPARASIDPLLINVERDFYPNYLRLPIRANQPLAATPKVKFFVGGKIVPVECIPQQPHRYVAAVPLAEIAGDSVRFEVYSESLFGQQEVWSDWFTNVMVKPGRGRSVFAPDARMRVAFADDSVYWPIYSRVSIDTVVRVRDSRVIGPVYHVEPQDVPLSNAAVVTISFPDTISQPRQLGVCYLDRGRWVFIENEVSSARSTVSARVHSLEDFAIIRDSEPPVLSVRTPHPGSVTHNRRPTISVGVYDSTSGFKSEESIELRLNDQLLIAEYDPERDVIQYRPKQDLAPGVYKLAVHAEDRCGNVARREWDFTIR